MLAACTPEPPEPLVIGYLGGISGRSAGLGLEGRDGATLAVEQINAAGGVDGRMVRLEIADDGPGDDASRQGVRHLAEQGAQVIVGPMTSSSAVAAAPIAAEVGVPLLSPTVSSTDFSGKDDYFFRICSDNQMFASLLASEAVGTYGAERVSIVVDDGNSSYTRTLGDFFIESLEEKGGRVTGVVPFVSGNDVKYEELAAAALGDDPQAVMVLANPVDAALICQRLRIAGFKGDFLLSQWAASSTDLMDKGGAAVEGAVFLDTYDSASKNPAYRTMTQDFSRRFGHEPNFAAVHAYDAANMAIAAAAGAEPGGDAKESLLRLSTWSGLQETFILDPNGDTARPFYLTRVTDGRLEPVERP